MAAKTRTNSFLFSDLLPIDASRPIDNLVPHMNFQSESNHLDANILEADRHCIEALVL
jgi:hypothetical protein